MKRPKRIILINRDFQLKYAKVVIFLGFISTVFTAALLLIPLYQFEILRIPAFLPLPIMFAMGIACTGNVIFIGLLGVHMTHRIAGPMYSLTKSFHEIERGRWFCRARIRKSDDLMYVVRNFNAMMDAISLQAKSDNQMISAIFSKLSLPDGDTEVNALLDGLKESYKTRLGYEKSVK